MADTIVAKATPQGYSGIAIVRLSGPDVPQLAQRLFPGRHFAPRQATLALLKDEQGSIDHCLVIYFPAPHSATGEHVLEVHTHGSPIISEYVMQRAHACGARWARPGEFSERAFMHGKLDLLQAEAVADLIHASSLQAVRSAARSMQGAFSDKVRELQTELTAIRVQVEALIDFSDEDISPQSLADIDQATKRTAARIDAILAIAQRGAVIREGLHVAIIGPSNAGKSSLFNALTEQESAIVTDIPGTTRDALKERILIEGLAIHMVDTAGYRQTQDSIEQQGIERAQSLAKQADHLLVVVDASQPEPLQTAEACLPEQASSYSFILNKRDLCADQSLDLPKEALFVSLRVPEDVQAIRQRLQAVAGLSAEKDSAFTARARHVAHLQRCQQHIAESQQVLLELRAYELQKAQQELDMLLGVLTQDDLLGAIFSTFCIGK